ncbi:MAG TPA: signal peptidase I, partial [Clostridia bacterium]|nr:signal peptidase I [Clostridia bacterium]
KLSVGDIVTFTMTDGRIVTHRIVEVLNAGTANESYRTKGDNSINSIDPDILTRDRILAVYLFKLPMT